MMLIIASVIAYVLSSVISFLESLGIRRGAAVILFFVVGIAAAILAELIFIPDLKEEMVNAYAGFPA